MTEFTFKVQVREGKARQTRTNGLIPAIIYGKNFENIKLALEEIAFNRLYKEAGTSNLIDLDIDGKKMKALISDVQLNPLNSKFVHIDFQKIDMKEKIKTEIPIEIVGETSLVVEQEGSLIVNKDAVEVECLPADLVDHINVDVSILTDFDQNIKVADLRVPAGVEILDDPEEVIVLVQPPRSEEELEALNEEVVEDVEAVEVENAGEETPVEGEEGAEAGEAKEDKEPKSEKEEKE